MIDDLIDRLRDFTEDDAYATPWTFGEVVREAADELTRLRAEVERLTAALADERAHADALAETLESCPPFRAFDHVAREYVLIAHRARRQG